MTSKGIPPHRYYYWCVKLRHDESATKRDAFVKIPNPSRNGQVVIIEYPNGVHIKFGEIPSMSMLQSLIKI